MTKVDKQQRCWYAIDLPLTAYSKAIALQHRLVELKLRGELDADVVLFLEHFPVFTMGRRGGAENLRVSESFLKDLGIALIQTERGGNITYHGPGQLVVYPVLELPSLRMGVVDYVGSLESVMIKTVSQWGIKATAHSVNRGVWVGKQKLGSIGITLRKSVTFHGLALNGNTDLNPFRWMHPCGLKDTETTSMAAILGVPVEMGELRKTMKDQMASVFGIRIDSLSPETLMHFSAGLNENQADACMLDRR